MLSQELIEGFHRLVAGDYAYRLPRSFAQDEEDALAFSFNAVAEELEKVIGEMRANEERLNNAVDAITAALMQVGAGNLDVHVERDYRGDQIDVLAFLVDTTIGELRVLVAENQKRSAEIQSQLEIQVQERTLQLQKLLEITQQQKSEIEAANRAKSAFLANMSHELRTPLNAILGFAQLMTRDSTLTAEQQSNLQIIGRSGEHLLHLINDVLEMSKIEAGRTVLNVNVFDLYHLLNDLENMFRLRAADKGLILTLDRAPNVPQYIQTDEGKLRQVLVNLVGNAVKFTQAGGVALRVRADSDCQSESSSAICFEVQDSGPGIAAEELDKIFEPFVQAGERKSQEGTGLGLPISRQFVRLLGGNLTASSTLGQGSLFRFDVHIEPADQAEIQSLKSEVRNQVMGLEPGQPVYRLLVVDDRDTNRKLLVKLLQVLGLPPQGFEVREASNGQEALDLWADWSPHLIWMDMRMPVMDGYEATRQIRARAEAEGTPKPVIIALTASAFEEDRQRILAQGCDDFVRKPFREEDIFDKLALHLRVRFIYERSEHSEHGQPEGEKAAGQETDESAVIAGLQSMPSGWLDELRQAALAGNVSDITSLIEQLQAQNTPTSTQAASALAKLADEFEHKAIATWVEQAAQAKAGE